MYNSFRRTYRQTNRYTIGRNTVSLTKHILTLPSKRVTRDRSYKIKYLKVIQYGHRQQESYFSDSFLKIQYSTGLINVLIYYDNNMND